MLSRKFYFYFITKKCFGAVFIMGQFLFFGCGKDSISTDKNLIKAPYMKELIEVDTVNAFKGDYYIEVRAENERTHEIKNLSFDASRHQLFRLIARDQGFNLSIRGIKFLDTVSNESLGISLYTSKDSLFYLNYADYRYASPWRGISGANVDYYVPVVNYPNTFYRFLGSDSSDSFFEINYIGDNHLNGTFSTKWEECCDGSSTTYNIEGNFSFPINDLWGIWKDSFVNGKVINIRETIGERGECIWGVEINSRLYKPKNLPDEFKINNLDVKVKYRLSNTSITCGDNHFSEINIYDIVSQ